MPEIYEPVVILQPANVVIDDTARIDSFVKIEGGWGVKIGKYVHVCSFCHVGIGGGKVVIGDFAGLSSGSKVLSGSAKPSGLSMSASAPAQLQVIERSETIIGAYAFLGVNSVVMPGVKVGQGAVIGAGAVVTKDVEPWSIVAGIPAKKIGTRSVPMHTEHY